MKQNHYGNMCWYCSNNECKFIYTNKLQEGMELEEGSKYSLKKCPYFIKMTKTKKQKTEWVNSFNDLLIIH